MNTQEIYSFIACMINIIFFISEITKNKPVSASAELFESIRSLSINTLCNLCSISTILIAYFTSGVKIGRFCYICIILMRIIAHVILITTFDVDNMILNILTLSLILIIIVITCIAGMFEGYVLVKRKRYIDYVLKTNNTQLHKLAIYNQKEIHLKHILRSITSNYLKLIDETYNDLTSYITNNNVDNHKYNKNNNNKVTVEDITSSRSSISYHPLVIY